MAKFTGKNIEFKDNQKAIFGNSDDSEVFWNDFNSELTITTVVSGLDPVNDGHLITKRHYDSGKPIAQWNANKARGVALPTPSASDDGKFLQYNNPPGNYNLTNDGTALSGIPYVYGDDVYFYDSTRSKHLGVSVIQVGCGRNSANTTNQYLRTFNGTLMNYTGISLPFDSTLVGVTMSGRRNTQSWTIYVRVSGSATNLDSLSINNSYENHSWNKSVDFSAGDRIRVYLSGSSIDYPQVRLFFRRRKV